MPLEFLTPRVERLSSDGRWTVLNPGGPLARFRPVVVLLARDLTAFSLFEAENLPWSRRLQAAQLHARTGSPYMNNDHMIVRRARDFGIWWWDSSKVTPLIQQKFGVARPLIRPETAAQPPGADWRIVRLSDGNEAQYWRNGALVATAWRRDRYDRAGWSAFVRSQRGAAGAPEAPPPAEMLPLAFDSPAFSTSLSDISREQLIGGGAGLMVLGSVGLTLLFAGQGLRLSSDADAIESEAIQMRDAAPKTADLSGLESGRRKLATYAELETRTSPISAAGAAVGIVAFHDLSPTAVEAEADMLTVTLPYEATSLVEVLVEDFETSGYFSDVRPRTDVQSQRFIIEMKTREAAPPLSAGE